jgi:hypothetical protein
VSFDREDAECDLSCVTCETSLETLYGIQCKRCSTSIADVVSYGDDKQANKQANKHGLNADMLLLSSECNSDRHNNKDCSSKDQC